MAIAILYRDELQEYDFGPGHPFNGDRYPLFLSHLRESLPEDNNYRIVQADWASDSDLLLICQEAYVTFTREYYKAANLELDYPGSFHRFHSGDNLPIGRPGKLEEAARLVVGQARAACDLVVGGTFSKAVSVGGGLHHAKPSYGEGFCLYNDVAFAAEYLRREHKLERILILDTDAHAGNGTAEYFYADPGVLLIDIHQDPSYLYPGTGFAHEIGTGDGRGFTVNMPMPVYSGRDSYRLVFDELLQPLVSAFKPQVIIRNGGSDPHFSDGLTSLGLVVDDFRMIGETVAELATVCDGRVIDLIASGYNRDVLPYCWLAMIGGLSGFSVSTDEPPGVPRRLRQDTSLSEARMVVDEVKRNLRDHWTCFT
jgi:acetoin utilization protein AcuC